MEHSHISHDSADEYVSASVECAPCIPGRNEQVHHHHHRGLIIRKVVVKGETGTFSRDIALMRTSTGILGG